jgi:bifunctional oligoribonuclease and PAP phosphatase NrnA
MVFNTSEVHYSEKLQQLALELLGSSQPIVIVAHVDPDGDALGSCLGLQRALRSVGKKAQTYMSVPRYLRFLVNENEILPPTTHFPENALLVVLDVDPHDTKRVEGVPMGDCVCRILNIDHHGTNARKADVHLVEPKKAACAQMVAELVETMRIPLEPQISNPLLLGIITDTGSFRFSNADADVFERAAKLLEGGANLAYLNDNLAQTPHYSYALQAKVLNTIEFLFDSKVITARVTQAMVEAVGASWEDVESLVGLIRSAEGTELAALFKDYGDTVKLSLRSRGTLSAQNIAIACGGGGHVAAAGATLHKTYLEARACFENAVLGEIERVRKD